MPETSPEPAPSRQTPPTPLIGFALGWLIMLAVILPAESERWRESESAVAWLFDWNVDTTPFLLLMLVAPLFWRIRRPLLDHDSVGVRRLLEWMSEGPPESSPGEVTGEDSAWRGRTRRAWVLAGLVGLVGFLYCLRVYSTVVSGEGNSAEPRLAFGDLPPALHDEFSYLFQAETFLAGQWSFFSEPFVPRVFDQMHVFNEGRFASRYFPGTGLWMAPFVATGNPWLGHHLATALICMLVFAIGRELSCNGVGLIAGLLTALSPGLVLFGNLLLAHQPTLLGLCLFIYTFLKMTRVLAESLPNDEHQSTPDSEKIGGANWFSLKKTDWICVSGYSLMFAMLCRPMTAAGVALPFGIWIFVWLIRNRLRARRTAVAVLTGYGVPLLLGFGIIVVHNKLITGEAFRTPYQLYTELLTPRHMYGFDNVKRAEPFLIENADRILDHYDRWAVNLDAELAVKNVGMRFLASWQWTLGLSALIVAGCVMLASGFSRRNKATELPARWWLFPAAILTLHLAHVPYWYDGILHWHYVFESGVLWCLVTAAATWILVRAFTSMQRPGMSLWWGAVLVVSVLINNVSVSPFWHMSRVEAGTHEFAYGRLKQAGFQALVKRHVPERPAVVLIRHDPADRHNDYVSNHPALNSPVLLGRLPVSEDAGTTQLSEIEFQTIRDTAEAFPTRMIYVVDIVSGQVTRIGRQKDVRVPNAAGR